MKKNLGHSIFRIQEYWSNPETGSHKKLPALSGVLSGKGCAAGPGVVRADCHLGPSTWLTLQQ